MGYGSSYLRSDLLQAGRGNGNGDYYGTGNNWTTRNQDAAFHSSRSGSFYAATVDQDTTIKGHIPVHFSAAFVKGDKNHAHVSATLMDVSDEEFDVVKEEITYDKDGCSTHTGKKKPSMRQATGMVATLKPCLSNVTRPTRLRVW